MASLLGLPSGSRFTQRERHLIHVGALRLTTQAQVLRRRAVKATYSHSQLPFPFWKRFYRIRRHRFCQRSGGMWNRAKTYLRTSKTCHPTMESVTTVWTTTGTKYTTARTLTTTTSSTSAPHRARLASRIMIICKNSFVKKIRSEMGRSTS